MKPVGNVRQIKKSLTDRQQPGCMVGEMEDMNLSISLNGTTQEVPILGVMTVDGNYYVTVLVQESGKEVVVIYKVMHDEDGEHLQIIEDKEEWNKVSKAWSEVLDAVSNKL